jgi:hypothetical protein
MKVVAKNCRNLKYTDGTGPVRGWQMLDYIKEVRAWIDQQEE